MSEAIATPAIEAKRLQLESGGRTVGRPRGAVKKEGSGGFQRRFDKAVVYWHANTGAHAVFGILHKRYLELGGPGAHPVTSRREFGFPTDDELLGELGQRAASFEFGRIHEVAAHRPVGTFGRFASVVKPGGKGAPLCEPIRTPAGEVVFMRHGCALASDAEPGNLLGATFEGPQLGRPALARGEAGEPLPVRIRWEVLQTSWDKLIVAHGSDASVAAALAQPYAGRLFLRSVANKADERRIKVTPRVPEETADRMVLQLEVAIDDNQAPMPQRTLMDLAIRLEGAETFPLGAHSVYVRRDWARFGFIHATDLHVTQRAETFRPALRDAGMAKAARLMTNPNDSVRALVLYANELHARGEIDFVLATGDLVDYVFEDDSRRLDVNNFAFLHKILMGKGDSNAPHSTATEELRVPIFTVLGNHDYVLNPAPLSFHVDLTGPKTLRVERYHGYDLTREEARAIQGGLVTIGEDEAIEALDSSESALPFYLSEINRSRNYLVEIDGRHRFVMIDTGLNKDVVDGVVDAAQEFLGFSNEDETTFVKELPNSAGRDDRTFADAMALQRPGVFVVGMHAPPLNTWGSEYAHFFRETERPGMDPVRMRELTSGYLRRQRPGLALTNPEDAEPDWFRGAEPRFHRGVIGDLLDFGIAKLRTATPDKFVEDLITGGVDLVLCGHVHERVEFRMSKSTGRLNAFTDFYTENPDGYRESWDWTRVPVVGLVQGSRKAGDERPIFLRVKPGAAVGAPPVEVRDKRRPAGTPPGTTTLFRRLDIPPYDDPLSDTKDPAAWWPKHRPLIVQTASVGPTDRVTRPEVDKDISPPVAEKPRRRFQGVRVIAVEGDNIVHASYMGIDDVRAFKSPPAAGVGPTVQGRVAVGRIGGVVAGG